MWHSIPSGTPLVDQYKLRKPILLLLNQPSTAPQQKAGKEKWYQSPAEVSEADDDLKADPNLPHNERYDLAPSGSLWSPSV